MVTNNPWLSPFIGNDPLCEGELGGHTIYKEGTTANFLDQIGEQRKKDLRDYIMKVQQAVNVRKENEECHTPTDEVEEKE